MENAVQNVIDYQTPHPRALTLEEDAGAVRVIFPLQPKWVRVVMITTPAIFGISRVAVGIAFVLIIEHIIRSTPTTPATLTEIAHLVVRVILSVGIEALVLIAWSVYQWRWNSRWGHVPQLLIANTQCLTTSRPGWWRLRERIWPASEILSIELRPLWGNLNRRTPSADLYVHLRKPKLVRFRLTSKDAELPSRIAKGIASALGCAVKIPSLSFAGEIANLKGKMNHRNAIIVLLGLAAGCLAMSNPIVSPSRDGVDFDHFADMSRAELVSNLNNLGTDRTRLETELIAHLRGAPPKQTKIAIVYLMGMYRMEGAVRDLATMIDFHDDEAGISKHLPLWDEWPAAQALARIGGRAAPEMVHNLATSDTPKVRELSAVVLRVVMGAGPAKEAVSEAIAAERGEKNNIAAARLEASIPLLNPAHVTQR